MIFQGQMDHEYATIIGIPEFTVEVAKLAFGEDSVVIKDKLVSTLS